jgi:2,3-bisphosphoglycerate-independent phosphoglycerate mutase
MKVLFIFLDGVGLGDDNPEINPFSRFELPNLATILGGQKLVANGTAQENLPGAILVENELATLMALDACLGVDGIPQSATGQASLLTGINVSAAIGFHDGPKPTLPILNLIKDGTVLSELDKHGRSAALVNAFPKRYFETIQAGYRIPGVIALSTQQAGFDLKTADDLMAGNAISADFTAEGWRSHLGFTDTPILSHAQAGERLNILSGKTDLSIFEYWLSDVAGHHQDMQAARTLLETIDDVLGSLFNVWDFDSGVILLTSDHGNLEDLSTRRHTRNAVPLLLIGSIAQRKAFIQSMVKLQHTNGHRDLTDVAPAILNYIG